MMLAGRPSNSRDDPYILFLLVVILLMIPTSSVVGVASAATGVTTLCSALPKSHDGGAIYPAKGGAFVEDWTTGNLLFCSGGTSKVIAKAPSAGSELGYWGMGGVKTSTKGLVLILTISSPLTSTRGLWVCYHASPSGCGSKSGFISLPSTFCSSESTHGCNPRGTAADKSLNLYYADPGNGLVECTASTKYKSCSNLPASNGLGVGLPYGLYLKGNTFYITDESCAGYVWKGTRSAVSVIATLGEELDSVTVSTKNPTATQHVYVGFTGYCTDTPAKVFDLTDGRPLPSPLGSPTHIQGLDSQLQFTSSVPGAAYKTSDSN
jgi:hypothetical protein